MSPKTDVLQGTLDLMVLKTLEALGPMRPFAFLRAAPIAGGSPGPPGSQRK